MPEFRYFAWGEDTTTPGNMGNNEILTGEETEITSLKFLCSQVEIFRVRDRYFVLSCLRLRRNN